VVKTVLVVEDDPRLARLAHLNLEAEGYRVVIFNEGIQACEYLKREKPDLILLDLMLSTISGWDILQTVNKDDRLKNIPVVVISALAGIDDQRRAKEEGAREYFIKPFGISELMRCVARLLAEKP
jgi:DNA-binding response OmpR family regulator